MFARVLLTLALFGSSFGLEASPVFRTLAAELNGMLTKKDIAGNLYIDSKFYGRFQVSKRNARLDFSMIGPLFVDYTYAPNSKRLVLNNPAGVRGPGLVVNSSAMNSIEWLLATLDTGVLAESPVIFKATRKLSAELDVFQLEMSGGPIKKVEVSILDTSTQRSLSRLRLRDASGKLYTFLFD